MNLMEKENFTGNKIFDVLQVDFLQEARHAIEKAMDKLPKKIRMMIMDDKLILYREVVTTPGMFLEKDGTIGIFKPDSEEESKGRVYETLAVVSKETSGIRITLMEEMTFETDSVSFKDFGKEILRAILDATEKAKLALTILNYKDDSPVQNPQFRNNWEFSTARSASIARFIQNEKLVQSENIRVSGLGDSRPIKSNDTEEGRWQNRRTELWLEPSYNWENSETPLVSMKIFETSAGFDPEADLVPKQTQKLDGMQDIDPLKLFPIL